MPKLFAAECDLSAESILLTGENADHLRVLRVRPGEQLMISDGRGMEALCVVDLAGKDGCRLRVLEGLTKKYDSLEAELVKGGMKQGAPETQKELETRFVEDVQSYGLFSDVTHLSTWEKICMFTITWRSVMLIFGFLGLGLALAIVSSSTVKSDLD